MSGDHVIYNDSGSFISTSVTHADDKRSPVDEAVSNKRVKMEAHTTDYLKQTLLEMHKAVLFRLDSIEDNIANVVLRCKRLEERMESFTLDYIEKLCGKSKSFDKLETSMSLVIDNIKSVNGSLPDVDKPVPTNCEGESLNTRSFSLVTTFQIDAELCICNGFTFLDDYPNGSWLGDENDAAARVRCCITPRDLYLINRGCLTPVKLALTLLDFLFDRETQACSNISGHSKHGKKPLDPLKIFGIRCHLKSRFNISEKVWQQIQKNLDSKCRAAYIRKQRGMSLQVRTFQDRRYETPYENSQESSKTLISVADQQSEVPDVSEVGSVVNADIQKESHDFSHTRCDSQTVAFDLMEHETKSESCLNDDEQHHQLTDTSGACAKQNVETVDHKSTALSSIGEQSFNILRHSAIIDIKNTDEQVIHTSLGDVRVVHAVQRELVNMDTDGRVIPFDIIIHSPSEPIHIATDVSNVNSDQPP